MNPFEPVQQQQLPIAQQPSWNTTPLKPGFNNTSAAQFSGVAPVQSFPSQVPPETYNPMNSYGQPAPAPPPTASQVPSARPSSVGPQNVSRSKYLVDPSVKSSYGGQSMYPQQQQSINTSTYGGYQTSMNPVNSYPSTMYTSESDYSTQPNANQSQIYDPVAQSQPQQTQQNYSGENFSYQSQPQQSGWNDPPISSSGRNKV